MSAIRVFVADEQTLLREGLKRVLDEADGFEWVGDAGDGQEAVRKILETKPDVVLLDVALPLLNGVDATRQVLKVLPDTKVLALTIYASDEYIFQVLDAGAMGYVLKDSALDDLARGIRLVHDGIPFFSPTISKVIVEGYLKRRTEAAPEDRSAYDELTQREREILQLIAEGHRNREVSEMLDLSIKTVEVHRAHIMEKLGARSLPDLVLIAIGRGLVKL